VERWGQREKKKEGGGRVTCLSQKECVEPSERDGKKKIGRRTPRETGTSLQKTEQRHRTESINDRKNQRKEKGTIYGKRQQTHCHLSGGKKRGKMSKASLYLDFCTPRPGKSERQGRKEKRKRKENTTVPTKEGRRKTADYHTLGRRKEKKKR